MCKLKRWLLGIAGILILVIVVAAAVFWKDIQEIRGAMDYANTFESDTIVENFRSLYKKYPSTTVKRSGPVYELSEKHRKLPVNYLYEGETKTIAEMNANPEPSTSTSAPILRCWAWCLRTRPEKR